MRRLVTKTYKVHFLSKMHANTEKLYELHVRAPSRLAASIAIRRRFGSWPKLVQRAINMDGVSDDAGQGATSVMNWRRMNG